MRDETGRNLNATQFLKLLVSQKPEIRVLLDVGAQMLELQNEELVRCWLKLRPDIEAAVYFNEEDELVALPQGGTPVPLYSSSFYQQLDRCIVYLDDGHTRGTDLKLPRNTRALVTLGPKVTKDRLLQGGLHKIRIDYGLPANFPGRVYEDAEAGARAICTVCCASRNRPANPNGCLQAARRGRKCGHPRCTTLGYDWNLHGS